MDIMIDYMILDVRKYWNKFFGVLTDLDMPEVDVDVLCSRMFDCLKDENLVEKKLKELCIDMATHDGLFENEHLDDGQQQRIYRALQILGKDLIEFYHREGMYLDGKAPYNYKGTFDGCALLLSDASFGSESPMHHTRHF